MSVRRWARLLPWLITAACFAYLYRRLDQAATAQGGQLVPYLATVFKAVHWSRWLSLMIPYCLVFFAIDTLVVWRVITWFHIKVRYVDVVPIRASAYILSLVNEQVSKGAMAVFLSRRYGIAGWEVASSMLFIMFCEYYYLLTWATLGVLLEWPQLPTVFHIIPVIALASGVFFIFVYLFVRGAIGAGLAVRHRTILRTFRLAALRHYGLVIALRSPAMVAAVVTYALALRLFGVDASVGDLFGYLPVIFFAAATPGPMHSVAVVLWVVLFPQQPGQMAAFGFVQHNFFVVFNAAIGLLFLHRATRELFARAPGQEQALPHG